MSALIKNQMFHFESLKINVLFNLSCFLLLWQIKYKEKFDNEMRDKKHHYNPLENASFRQSQLVTALVSDVSYFVPQDLCVTQLFSVSFESTVL